MPGTAQWSALRLVDPLFAGTPVVAAAGSVRELSTRPLLGVEADAAVGFRPRRRDEFAAGRACARLALARLGMHDAVVPRGPVGAPCWPEGVVGSIAHTGDLVVAAVAPRTVLTGLGIDAEPNLPVPERVMREFARPEEFAHVRELRNVTAAVELERLLFAAKEAAVKIWSPLTGRWLSAQHLCIRLDLPGGRFYAQLLSTDAHHARLQGRWLLSDGMLITGACFAA